MLKDLIEIKQLPVIEEQLKSVSKEIDEKVKNATSLVCTDETVKTVKELRANLNKDFKEFETKRKEIKEKVLAPYMQFENIYKECISDKYKKADVELKEKIDSVEKELKANKEQEVKKYFEEYKMVKCIDFVSYEQTRINVTLSASMKSLKEQVKQFIDKIVDDLNLIETQQYKTEILVEYKNTLNVSHAITTVMNRIEAVEEEMRKQEEVTKKISEGEIVTGKEKSCLKQSEKTYTITFTVTDSAIRLKQLKNYLVREGYQYE